MCLHNSDPKAALGKSRCVCAGKWFEEEEVMWASAVVTQWEQRELFREAWDLIWSQPAALLLWLWHASVLCVHRCFWAVLHVGGDRTSSRVASGLKERHWATLRTCYGDYNSGFCLWFQGRPSSALSLVSPLLLQVLNNDDSLQYNSKNEHLSVFSGRETRLSVPPSRSSSTLTPRWGQRSVLRESGSIKGVAVDRRVLLIRLKSPVQIKDSRRDKLKLLLQRPENLLILRHCVVSAPLSYSPHL